MKRLTAESTIELRELNVLWWLVKTSAVVSCDWSAAGKKHTPGHQRTGSQKYMSVSSVDCKNKTTVFRTSSRTVLLYKSILFIFENIFPAKSLSSARRDWKTRLTYKSLYDKGLKLLPSKSKSGRTHHLPDEGHHLWREAARWNRALQSGGTPITTSPEALAEPKLNYHSQLDPWPNPEHLAVTCTNHKPCLFLFSTKSPSFSQPLKNRLDITKTLRTLILPAINSFYQVTKHICKSKEHSLDIFGGLLLYG